MKKLSFAVALAAGSLFVSMAQAQWQWIDNTGRKIYSDQAPPPSIPESKILRGANGQPYVPKVQVAAPKKKDPKYQWDTAAPEPAAKASAAVGAAKKPAEKSAKEKAEEAKKKAEEAAKEAEAKRKEEERMADNCKRLKGNLASIDSGVRIGVTNEKGERSIMDDAQRAAERRRVQDLMAENKCN